MKKSYEQLKSDYKKQFIKAQSLKWKIEEIEEKQKLPELKAELEGQFFKYHNAYSGTERWWKYYYVIEVKSLNRVKAFCFETTTRGETLFHPNKDTPTNTLELKIYRSEFLKELVKARARMEFDY